MSILGAGYAQFLARGLTEQPHHSWPSALARLAATGRFPEYDSDESGECQSFIADLIERQWIANRQYPPDSVNPVHAGTAYVLFHFMEHSALIPSSVAYAIVGFADCCGWYMRHSPKECVEYSEWVCRGLSAEPILQWLASVYFGSRVGSADCPIEPDRVTVEIAKRREFGMSLVEGHVAHTVWLRVLTSLAESGVGRSPIQAVMLDGLQEYARAEVRLLQRKGNRRVDG